jgi:uncharacterized membrane protein
MRLQLQDAIAGSELALLFFFFFFLGSLALLLRLYYSVCTGPGAFLQAMLQKLARAGSLAGQPLCAAVKTGYRIGSNCCGAEQAPAWTQAQVTGSSNSVTSGSCPIPTGAIVYRF